MEVVGESQGGSPLLTQLAAAASSPLPLNRDEPAARLTGGSALDEAEATGGTADGRREGAGRPSPATAVAPLATAAAATFASTCTLLGVEPHAQLLRVLEELPDEAFTPPMPGHRPGAGGAVLKVPPTALPQHLDALLMLVTGRRLPPLGSSDGAGYDGQGNEEVARFLLTVHLDLSWHAVSAAHLSDLLAEAPHRRWQGSQLEGLELQGCQLPPDALLVLKSWKAHKTLASLRRLVLADNPLLGCTPCQALAAAAATAPQQQQQQQAGGAGAGQATGGCLGPAQLRWLQTRLFQAAPLCLLDIRRTGFSDAALGCLMHQLATYPQQAATAAGKAGPEAPGHAGCRSTLECLRLGPPADQPHFSQQTVYYIVQALQGCPQLQAVELLGLEAGAESALLAVWQQAQQRLGRQGYAAVPGTAGVLRLALTQDGAAVAAERPPHEHVPLQPATPEPRQQPELEVEQLPAYSGLAPRMAADVAAEGEVQQRKRHQQPLTTYLQPSRHVQDGRVRQQQVPRVPGAAAPRQRAPIGAREGMQWEGRGGEGQPAAVRQQGGGQRRIRGSGGGGGGGAQRQGGGGAAGRPRQRRRTNGVLGGGKPPMYRGGARADELRVAEIDLVSDEEGGPRYYGSGEDDDEYEDTDAEDEADLMSTDGSSQTDEGGGSGHYDAGGRQPGLPSLARRAPAAAPDSAVPGGGRRRRGGGSSGGAAAGGGGGDEGSECSSLSDLSGYSSDKCMEHYRDNLATLVIKLKRKDKAAGELAEKAKKVWKLAENYSDRRRWKNPSSTQNDLFAHLSALLDLKQLAAAHGLRFHFPFPANLKKKVLQERLQMWREGKLEWKPHWGKQPPLAQQQQQQQQQPQQQQQQQQPQQRQGKGRRRVLKRAGEVEMEDSSEDGGGGAGGVGGRGAAAAAATQQQVRRQRIVSEDEEEEQRASRRGNGGSGVRQQEEEEQEQHVAGFTPRAAAAEDGQAAGVSPASSSDGLPDPRQQQRQHGGEHQQGGSVGRSRGSMVPSSAPQHQAQQLQQQQQQQEPQSQQQRQVAASTGTSGAAPGVAAASAALPAPPGGVGTAPALLVPSQVVRAAAAEAEEAEGVAVQRQLALHADVADAHPTAGHGLPAQERGEVGVQAAAERRQQLQQGEQQEGEQLEEAEPEESVSLVIPDSCSEDEFGI